MKTNKHKKTSYSKTTGFSLIEILIVIAILGSLMMFAVPNYGKYLFKSKVLEVLNIIHPHQVAMVEHYFVNNIWPNAKDLALDDGFSIRLKEKHVEGIQITGGSVDKAEIKIRFRVDDQKRFALSLRPKLIQQRVEWSCRPETGGINAVKDYIPTICLG